MRHMEVIRKQIYEAPSIQVIEVRQKCLICASPNGGTESFGLGENYSDGDFE